MSGRWKTSGHRTQGWRAPVLGASYVWARGCALAGRTITGRMSSSTPNPQNAAYGHGFKKGDRVAIVDGDVERHGGTAPLEPGKRGTVTYDRKLRRVGVKFDDDGSTAQIRTRYLRKLDELEVLVEGYEAP